MNERKAGAWGIMYFSILVALSGCAGTTKTMSDHLAGCEKWAAIPPEERISIRMLKPIASPSQFLNFAEKSYPKILAVKLKESQLFNDVSIISSNEAIPTNLLIEVKIANIALGKPIRYFGYSSGGIKGEFAVAERVIDVNKDQILITCESTRISDRDTVFLTSGAFWDGIPITSEENFIKNLMEWVAEDTTEMFKKVKEGGK
jgi:hypothetical protein